MNPLLGILLCVLSTIGFTLMGAMVRYIGDRVPVGEMVFARNFVVLVPLVLVLAMRGELRKTIRTKNLRGHVTRSFANIVSIFCNYGGLVRIPLAEATAIGFAIPLFTVALAAIFFAGDRTAVALERCARRFCRRPGDAVAASRRCIAQ